MVGSSDLEAKLAIKIQLVLWLDLHNKMHVRVLLLKDIGLALVVFLFVS